jgi:SAM-dependent methyltransferase
MSSAIGTSTDNLLPLLACPICKSPLEILPSEVRCQIHGSFRRHGALVSFLQDEQLAFDEHWAHAAEVQRPEAKAAVARRFLSTLESVSSAKDGRPNILDIGCGDGVHIEQLLASEKRFSIVGLDYSLHALRSAMQIAGSWLPIHADAQHLPFVDNAFDAVFSFGVQAYLEDRSLGLREMVRVTKPGGLIGLWYAPRRRGVAGTLFATTRRIVPRLPRWAQRRVADTLVPFLGLMPTSSTLGLTTGSWRECREVILVNIAPAHIAFPTATEIIEELLSYDCKMIFSDGAIEGEYWARKAAQ